MKLFLLISVIFFIKSVSGACQQDMPTTEVVNSTVTTTTVIPTTVPSTTETSPTTISTVPTTETSSTEPTTHPASTTTETSTVTSTTESSSTASTSTPTVSSSTEQSSLTTAGNRAVGRRIDATIVNSCPNGFYDVCKLTCDCLNPVADNNRINELNSTFLVDNPGTYTNPTLEWAECLRVKNVTCSTGNPMGLVFTKADNSLKDFGFSPNTLSNSVKYNCTAGNWHTIVANTEGEEAYYTCKS